MPRLAGVDGCKNGWMVALAEAWPAPVDIRFGADFEAVLELTRPCLAIAIDMPIGLPDGGEPRACDLAARIALGPQRSSIFLAPPRSTLAANDPREFQRLHRQLRHGAGAGLPVWGIVPKMREVNAAFENDAKLQRRAFEFHPELTWKRLAQGRVLTSKKTVQGILERIALLNHSNPGWLAQAPPPVEGSPAIDDVLDAIVGLASAAAFLEGNQYCLPLEAPHNDRGLAMQIRY